MKSGLSQALIFFLYHFRQRIPDRVPRALSEHARRFCGGLNQLQKRGMSKTIIIPNAISLLGVSALATFVPKLNKLLRCFGKARVGSPEYEDHIILVS